MSKPFLCPNCNCVTMCTDNEKGFCCNNRCNTITAQRLQKALADIKYLNDHINKMSCCCAGCTKHNQDLGKAGGPPTGMAL